MIVTELVSNAWVTCFLYRQGDHLISKWFSGMDSLCHNADSNVKYSLYFDLLHAKMKQNNIQPCHCYNMNEKGFMIGVTERFMIGVTERFMIGVTERSIRVFSRQQ
jgi:hypothetical protein